MATTGRATLDALLDERRDAARAQLAEAMRTVARQADPAVDPDSTLALVAYHEPRFYCQFARPGFDTMAVGQLLFQATDRADPVVAVADDAGVLAFPGLGRCHSNRPGSTLTLRWDDDSAGFTAVTDDPDLQLSPLVPATLLSGTRMELIGHLDPVLGWFLGEHIEPYRQLEIVTDAGTYPALLEQALDLVRRACPELSAALAESVRAVLLYRHPDAESFAALGMHGTIFINLTEGDGLAFFVEHLVHQGGHVLFSEATLARADFFVDSPDARLDTVTHDGDIRTLYDIFHGLFTEHVEQQVFTAVLRQDLPAGADRAAFEEHLATVNARLARDLALVEPHLTAIFTAAGAAVWQEFRAAHEECAPDAVRTPHAAPTAH